MNNTKALGKLYPKSELNP